MRINNKLILLWNLAVLGLFLYPLRQLDLFRENYSTLSLNGRGYLYLLMLGGMIGILCGYETGYIHSKRNGYLVFFSLILGTIVPHHVPYNFQGNLHLLFAYTSAFLFTVLTYLNIQRDMHHQRLYGVLMLGITAAAVFYMKAAMVNCISEVILMCTLLFINWYLYITKQA